MMSLHPTLTALAAAALSAAAPPAAALTYAIDFVATAATGAAMDPSGRIIAGSASLPPACAGCPPTFGVPSLWADGQRFDVTVPAGKSYITFANINAQGWVAGTAWDFSSTTGAAIVWKPRPGLTGFDAVALGTLPGLAGASAAGIDDQGRVVGLSSTWFGGADPFLWTEAGGMVSLTAMGHVADAPFAISPGGTVATRGYTYTLGNPSSTRAVAPAPSGYSGSSASGAVVNDAGTRATFLLTTVSDPLAYPFRYSDDGGWQSLGAGGTGHLSSYGLGSIDGTGTVTFTALSTGLRAGGPAGLAQSLAALVSPAYGATSVTLAGDQGSDGSVLASAIVGRSARLVKLVPAAPCTANCLRAASLSVTGYMVSRPPGQCTATARNVVTATLQVVDENGLPMSGAQVSGRFLDDYYLNSPVTLTTNRRGSAVARHDGPACVGAIAFLVERVTLGSRTLDRTVGTLAGYVIPLPR